MRKFLGLALVSLSLVGCASTTMIQASDSSVQIFVDGQPRGVGSVLHSDSKIVGMSTNVTLKKDGCKPQVQTFSRTESFAVGPFIAGWFLLVPWLWIMDYHPTHSMMFVCDPVK